MYGLLYVLFPYELSDWVTAAVPASTSAVIDVRATYGGMSIAVGIMLVMLTREAATLRSAVAFLTLLMACMAGGRIAGMLLDGDPNFVMYLYLVLEIVTAAACCVWLRLARLPADTSDRDL